MKGSREDFCWAAGSARDLLNTVQKRRVSSPAPVTMVSPQGDIARYSTRYVCPVGEMCAHVVRLSTITFRVAVCRVFHSFTYAPVRVAIGTMAGYFHTTIWCCEYPCVLTSSLAVLDHARLHTCVANRSRVSVHVERSG